ncbi:CHAT domain-containing protein [Streptomyces sp. NPDC002688]|uniref:CHAT domain-containing protein n=1 Tax=Streptomyces sp. NPDC002688 TaxID=3154423 RepID=UPI0033187412
MSTILIQVGDLQAAGFPENLCIDDGTDPRWFEHPRAQDLIPDGKLTQCPSLTDDSIPPATLLSTGRELFDALLSGTAGEVWKSETAGGGLRVVLDIQPGKLRLLPWELLCTPAPQERWLFEDEARPFVRAHVPFDKQAEPLTGPVRLLVVVGDPEDGDLSADSELDAIYAGLSSVPCCWQTHVLRAPSQDATRAAFIDFAPHILHFIGHGKHDAASGVALEIMNPDAPWSLSAGYIAGALAAPLRLAVLNACRTTGDSACGLVWGISDAFFETGTLAVVAMQGDIASTPAVRFSKEFYGHLAMGNALDEAMAHARNNLHWASGVHPRDRAVPVLTVQADPLMILKWPDPIDHAEVTRQLGDAFDGPRWLVGRAKEQHLVSRRMASTPSSPEADLLVITGENEAGKSELIRSCILTSSWRGVPVVYVNLSGKGALDLPAMLTLIAESAAEWLKPEAKKNVSEYTKMLDFHRQVFGALRAGTPAPAAQPGQATPPLPDKPLQPKDLEDHLIREFSQFMKLLANGKPLLLVLDHVLRAEKYGHVVERLLKPAAVGKFDPVRVVAVDSGLQPRLGTALANRIMAIKPFERKEAELLVREYCARKRDWYQGQLPDERAWATFAETMRQWALKCQQDSGTYFSPKELKTWETLAQTLAQGTP